MKFSSSLAQGLQKDLVAGEYKKAATDLLWGMTIVGPPIENVANTLLDYNEGKITIDDVNERMGEQIGNLAGALILSSAIKESPTKVVSESTTKVGTKLQRATGAATETAAATERAVASEVSTRSTASVPSAAIREGSVAGERAVGSSALSESAAVSEINPRLTQRIEAWRRYQTNGGTMDLQGWVQHTQGAPWGTGARSSYGDWIRSVESVHGNSSLSSRPATLYRLETKTGDFLKWGITQDIESRYTTAFMRDKQIFEVATGTRSQMLKLERQLVESQPGKLNREPWAGSRRTP